MAYFVIEWIWRRKKGKKVSVLVNTKNIRIFNGCEVLIENSVMRVTDRHHEAKFRHEGNWSASRGLPSDAEQLPEWQNFQFAPHH